MEPQEPERTAFPLKKGKMVQQVSEAHEASNEFFEKVEQACESIHQNQGVNGKDGRPPPEKPSRLEGIADTKT